MIRPENIATPAEFARQLKAASSVHQPAQLSFIAPTMSLSSDSNQSSAYQTQDASYVMGWGSTEQPSPFRGLNGNYAQANVHFSVDPIRKAVTWIAINR